MPRFAGLGEGLAKLFAKGGAVREAFVPSGGLQIALTTLPDLAIGGFTASSMPDGTTPLQRILVGTEAALGSYGAGGVGRLAGTQLARRLAPGNLEAQQTVGTLAEMATGFMPLPAPYRDSVIQERIQRDQEEQQLLQQQQAGEQLLHTIAATGQLAAPSLVPAGTANPFLRLV